MRARLAGQLCQLGGVRLDEVRLEWQRAAHGIAVTINQQRTAGLFDDADDFQVLLFLHSWRDTAAQNEQIVRIEIGLELFDKAQIIFFLYCGTRFVEVGVFTARMDNLCIGTGLARDVGEIVRDSERSQCVFQRSAIISRRKTKRYAFAADCTDRSGNVDAASTNFYIALYNAVHRAQLHRCFQHQGAVNRRIQRYGNNHWIKPSCSYSKSNLSLCFECYHYCTKFIFHCK